ncbi:MAG: sugar kinase [Armatimonadia bacterium]
MEILSIGELIVEIMRKEVDAPLCAPADFTGPYPSGAPAIFADQAARLGHQVGFIGAVGDDDFGLCLTGRLADDGLDTSYIARVASPASGCAFVTYFSDGTRKFVFHIGNSAAGQLPEPDPAAFVGLKWLHICGSTLSASPQMRERCYRACELAAQAGARIAFDPNLRPELLGGEEALRRVCGPVLQRAALVLPSASEAQVLTGQADAAEACQALLDQGCEVVALKRGAEGCTVYSPAGVIEAPSFSVQAVDPTGAGDCFDAGFVVGLLEELPLSEVARLANACGALGATRKGPMEGARWRDEVEALLAAQG